MHFLVGLAAALAQDADAVDDDVDVRQQRLPCVDAQQPLEPDQPSLAFMCKRLADGAQRAPEIGCQ